MELIIIAAVAENRVIGYQGGIPWHFKEDLSRFKDLTLGHPVIMGRKTHESIIERLGHPLEDRTNIVLTRNYKISGVIAVNSFNTAIEKASIYDNIAYVIGGQSVYENAIRRIETRRMELTEIHTTYEGDTFFPEFNKEEWAEKERVLMKGFDWVTYVRKYFTEK